MPISRKIMGVKRGRVFTGALSNAGYYTTPTYTFGSAVSPDGKNIYCPLNSGLQILNRNVSTGALTTGTNISTGNKYTDRCCVSPDSKHVYLCLSNDHWIRLYNRNLSTGELTYVADYDIPITGQLRNVQISPDGNSVHAYKTNNIYVLQRNSSTGALTYSYNYAPSSNDTTRGVFSLNGLYYYNLGYYGELYIYSRTPATGQLTFIVSINVGGDSKDSFLTSDELQMYIANNYGIKRYSRNPTTGLLTYLSYTDLPTLGTNGCGGCIISPDNKNIYYSWVNLGYISRFDRDASTGLLTYNSSIYVGSSYYPTLPFMPPDGGNVYCDNNLAGLITLTRS